MKADTNCKIKFISGFTQFLLKSREETNMGNTVPKHGFVLGLDCAGKSTMVYNLTKNEPITEIPIMSFYPSVNFCGFKITDLGGNIATMRHFKQIWHNADFIIFVVDSADRSRIFEAQSELHELFNDEGLKYARFLIISNKNDKEHAMSCSEVIEKLSLHEYTEKNWSFMQCSAATEGEWINEVRTFLDH
jgi:GTPase SAR1 family protein